MTNPYAAPEVQHSDEPSIRVPDGSDYVVAGDDLFCRSDLDISEVCYITGTDDIVKVKVHSFACLPLHWQTYSSIIVFVIGVALLVSGFLALPGSKFMFLILWVPLCLGMAIFGHLQKKLKIRYGLSQTGKRDRWKRVARTAFTFGSIFVAATALAAWLGLDSQIIPMGFCLCISPFLYKEKYPSAMACLDGTFRIRNLSPALLAALKNADKSYS